MTYPKILDDAMLDLEREIESARQKHAPMNTPHEGYAVILEELDELWDEIKVQKHNRGTMRKEALQVAAMAMRFIYDLCATGPKGRERE